MSYQKPPRYRSFSHRSFYGNYGNFKAALTQSFKDLRRLGYFARQNFECCQSCAWAVVPEEKEDKVVFYHRQDTKTLEDDFVYLAWAGDGKEIVSVLQKYFDVSWSGSEHDRIIVKFSRDKYKAWDAEKQLEDMRKSNKKRPEQSALLEEQIIRMYDRLERAIKEGDGSRIGVCLDQAQFWTKVGHKEDAESWMKEANIYL